MRKAMEARLAFILFIWTSILASADQVVYLDRPNIGPTEPYFNPKSLNASVGEQIHFVARFNQTTKVP